MFPIFFFHFSQWDNESNLFEILPVFSILTWTTIYILILCEPGTKMINQFEMFGAELSRCDWYSLSVEMQRIYLIFLSDTQNPMKVSSYGNITCERETFKTVWIVAVQSLIAQEKKEKRNWRYWSIERQFSPFFASNCIRIRFEEYTAPFYILYAHIWDYDCRNTIVCSCHALTSCYWWTDSETY